MDLRQLKGAQTRALVTPPYYRLSRTVPSSRALYRAPQAAFSADALESLKNARKEASRQGSMFVGCDHLLLGITGAQNSAAAKLLRDQGFDPASMRDVLDASRVMPSSSYMQPSDVDFAPDARAALSAATAASQAVGRGP
jgi:ATP-dependent Clp protease ATP-binding subunit ClpA